MLKRIHINQHILKSNIKNSADEPCITVKTSAENIYGHEVKIHGPSSVVYPNHKVLNCGARCWVETESPITVIIRNGEQIERG